MILADRGWSAVSSTVTDNKWVHKMKSHQILVLAMTCMLPISCGKNSASSDLEAARPSSFKAQIAKVSCVLKVEDDAIVTIGSGQPSSSSQHDLGLIITVKDNLDASTCASEISSKVKGFQLRNVLSSLDLITSRKSANTRATPRNLESALKKVSCVTFVEKELQTSLNGTSRATGNLIVGMKDQFTAHLCAEEIYAALPGTEIRTQVADIFVVKGK